MVIGKAAHEKMADLAVVRIGDSVERIEVALHALRRGRRHNVIGSDDRQLNADLSAKRAASARAHRSSQLRAGILEEMLLPAGLGASFGFAKQLDSLDLEQHASAPRSDRVEVVAGSVIEVRHASQRNPGDDPAAHVRVVRAIASSPMHSSDASLPEDQSDPAQNRTAEPRDRRGWRPGVPPAHCSIAWRAELSPGARVEPCHAEASAPMRLLSVTVAEVDLVSIPAS